MTRAMPREDGQHDRGMLIKLALDYPPARVMTACSTRRLAPKRASCNFSKRGVISFRVKRLFYRGQNFEAAFDRDN